MADQTVSQNPTECTLAAESFEGRAVPRVYLHGQWLWPARAAGRVVEPRDDGKRFVRNVVEGEGVEGVDFVRVVGDDLTRVSALLFDGAESAPSNSRGGSRREMILFTESGLHLALMATRAEVGRRMRLWLAREVLPAIRATGRYEASPDITAQLHAALAPILAELADARAEAAEARRELAELQRVFSPQRRWQEIQALRATLVELRRLEDPSCSPAVYRGRIDVRLRALARYGQDTGYSLRAMPLGTWETAKLYLESEIETQRRLLKRVAQLPLPAVDRGGVLVTLKPN